jgi:hypothetical protein
MNFGASIENADVLSSHWGWRSMKRSSRRAPGSPAPTSPPTPPVGGWTLMEAATVLCPRQAALYREGGAELDAAITSNRHRLSRQANREPSLRPHAWLSICLLDQLSQRPDLQLTARSNYDPAAPRLPIEADIVQEASRGDNRNATVIHRWVHFNFDLDHATIGRDLPRNFWDDTTPAARADVRVEPADTLTPDHLASSGSSQASKPDYSPKICAAWLRLRVVSWPKDRPPSTEAECHAAAEAYFGIRIPRDPFREIRREAVPDAWYKSGPRNGRGPRN